MSGEVQVAMPSSATSGIPRRAILWPAAGGLLGWVLCQQLLEGWQEIKEIAVNVYASEPAWFLAWYRVQQVAAVGVVVGGSLLGLWLGLRYYEHIGKRTLAKGTFTGRLKYTGAFGAPTMFVSLLLWLLAVLMPLEHIWTGLRVSLTGDGFAAEGCLAASVNLCLLVAAILVAVPAVLMIWKVVRSRNVVPG